jgi:hypothetical protein
MSFVSDYQDLLIRQYFDQPNAMAQVEVVAAIGERIRDLYADFPEQFDPDTAVGTQLDIVGKIVGISRNLPEPLSDSDYRFYIRLKIAKNNASAVMSQEDRLDLQDVIQFAFNGNGTVYDNQDMSLTLDLFEDVSYDQVNTIVEYDLLPKPQGVRYDIIVSPGAELPFGFSELGQPDPTDVLGYGELGLNDFELSTGDTLELSSGDILAITDSENPVLPTTGGEYAELIEV